MSGRPEYRDDLVPGQRHFACTALRATLSTSECARRWRAAGPGETCCSCCIGRTHFGDHNTASATPTQRGQGARAYGECARCGRTDLRLIHRALCVSCQNREYEWLKGRNAKGKVPAEYTPPHLFEVAVRQADGRIEQRVELALHGAEAVGRALRNMPDGARLVAAPRPGRPLWNSSNSRFEFACPSCGALGLLERVMHGGLIEHRCGHCGGASEGDGWRVAPVRMPARPMDVCVIAEFFSANRDLADEVADVWTPTAFACTCGASQIAALLSGLDGRWKCRCRACGAESDGGAS